MGAQTEPVTSQVGLAEPDGAEGLCAACGHAGLTPHLRVKHDLGRHGLIPSTDRFGSALSDIVACRACGHMQLTRLPPAASLIEQYSGAASMDYVEEEAGQRRTAREALQMIERHASPGALLDVGCWVGFLLDEAGARGWRTVGLEPSAFASQYAREHLSLDVRTADLFAAELPERAFDAAVLADVLEHLPDPGAALERISRAMAPGGVVYLALPDAGSRLARILGARWWSVIPTHVQYFTRRSLQTLLAAHGWEILELQTAPKAFTVRYYLGRLRGYSPAAATALATLARALGFAERLTAPDFRDRMAVVARTPS